MKKKILFIMANGGLFINNKPENGQWPQLLPKAISSLSEIAAKLDYELVLVDDEPSTEQVARQNIIGLLKGEGIVFANMLNNTDVLQPFLYGHYDPAHSFVAGNAGNAARFAQKTGCTALVISTEENSVTATSWESVYRHLTSPPRIATVNRVTTETNIAVTVNIDGTGKSHIDTGIGFFNHMLEQVARHGNMDMEIHVQGDLHIDEHHTIEDTAIAFGEAVWQALGAKKSIERYGFMLPMDDCLAQTAIDFGGRPWLVWNTAFKREKLGELPTEMLFHFFKSFTDHARCNLNITAEGENEHHKAEAIFKAFAKAIKMAVAKTNQPGIPSTKGIL